MIVNILSKALHVPLIKEASYIVLHLCNNIYNYVSVCFNQVNRVLVGFNMNNTWLQYIDRKRFVLMGFFLMLIKTYIHTKLVGFSFRHAMIFWKNNYIMWCLQHDISSVNFLMHPSPILLLHYLSSISQNRYQ